MKKSTLIGAGLLAAALSLNYGCANKGASIQTTNKAFRDALLTQTEHTQNITAHQAYNLRKNGYEIPEKNDENKRLESFKKYWDGLIRSGYNIPQSAQIPTQIEGFKKGLDTVIELVQANAMMGKPVPALTSSTITLPYTSWEDKYNAAFQLVKEYNKMMPILATEVRTHAVKKGIENTMISARASDAASIAMWSTIIGFGLGKSSSETKIIANRTISEGSSSGFGGPTVVTNNVETPIKILPKGPWQP